MGSRDPDPLDPKSYRQWIAKKKQAKKKWGLRALTHWHDNQIVMQGFGALSPHFFFNWLTCQGSGSPPPPNFFLAGLLAIADNFWGPGGQGPPIPIFFAGCHTRGRGSGPLPIFFFLAGLLAIVHDLQSPGGRAPSPPPPHFFVGCQAITNNFGGPGGRGPQPPFFFWGGGLVCLPLPITSGVHLIGPPNFFASCQAITDILGGPRGWRP